MNKTFITRAHDAMIQGFKDKSNAIVKRISDEMRDAIDEIVNLFEAFDLSKIDIENYDDEFTLCAKDDYSRPYVLEVSRVEFENGVIYVMDKEGFEHESYEWGDEAPVLLNELAECLSMKFEDIKKLAVGVKVRWINPGIEDYPEEEREEILRLVWVIDSCPDEIEEDSVIAISNEYGEAEVLPMELVVVEED